MFQLKKTQDHNLKLFQFTKEQYSNIKPEDLSIAYVAWNKRQEKYVTINHYEEKGLEIIKIEKNKTSLNFLAVLIEKWSKFKEIDLIEEQKNHLHICRLLHNIVKKDLNFLECYEFIIYGKNPKTSIVNRQYDNIYGIGVYEVYESWAAIKFNLAYPDTQIKKEERKNNTIGRVGTNIGNFMLQDIFNKKYDAVICESISDKVITELKKFGFTELTPELKKVWNEYFRDC